jgi:hypothetical protein
VVTKRKNNTSWAGLLIGGTILAIGGYKVLSSKQGAEQIRFSILEVAFDYPSYIKVRISLFNPSTSFSTKITGMNLDVIYNGTTISTLQSTDEIIIPVNSTIKKWLPFKIDFVGTLTSLYQRLIMKQKTSKKDIIQLIGFVNTPFAQININETYNIA